jgi:hypothetical protein
MKSVAVFFSAMILLVSMTASDNNPPRVPVLVELFTSEGCSSCPPADALLQKFDSLQPVPGAQLIVLSEHVDYWNHIGWKDPFSAHFYSDRQSAYASRFGLGSVYTPQMIVDGASEFTGSEQNSAEKAIEKALRLPKLNVALSSVKVDAQNHLRARLKVEGASSKGEVFFVLALEHAQSQVARGENAGRSLSHTGVVKNLIKVGDFKNGDRFAKDIDLKLDSATSAQNLRIIAFVQEAGQGKVLGATQQSLKK